MKPLNDNQLKKVLREKIGGLESPESDHLWSDIEQALPTKTTANVAIAILKMVAIVGLIAVVVFTSFDSNGELQNDQKVEKRKTELPQLEAKAGQQEEYNDFGTTQYLPSKQGTKNIHAEENLTLMTEEKPEKIQSKSKEELAIVPSRQIESEKEEAVVKEKKIKEPNVNHTKVRFLQSMLAPVELAKLNLPVLHLQNIQDSNPRRVTWFWSTSSYLTFHTLEPSRIDEHLVSADPNRVPELSDRIGLNVRINRSQPLSKRISFVTSLSIDYYKTKFFFQVINVEEPAIVIENSRLDVGINAGFDIRPPGMLERGLLGVDLGARTRVVDFLATETNGYRTGILTYRITYLIEVSSLKVGPMYSSFINTREREGYGRISPSIYGFTIRGNLRKREKAD